jgi:hypothetical protein
MEICNYLSYLANFFDFAMYRRLSFFDNKYLLFIPLDQRRLEYYEEGVSE